MELGGRAWIWLRHGQPGKTYGLYVQDDELGALGVGQAVDDDADVHAEEAVDLSHPVGIAAGQVIIHGNDMHALAGDRIQVSRQGCSQRLAFAGAHFGDLAVMQHHSADQLHIVMAHPQYPRARLAHNRKCFGQEGIQRFALGNSSGNFLNETSVSAFGRWFTGSGSNFRKWGTTAQSRR